MAPAKAQHTSTNQQTLLDAQLQLWHHAFGYVKSMALKAALDLGIPDAIHQHGGSATLPQIVTELAALHPSKTPCLRRLMRVLTLTGVFGVVVQHSTTDGGSDLVYELTPASRLLVGSAPSNGPNVSPFLNMILGTAFVSSFLDLGEWFQHELPDPSPFKLAHGQHVWDMARHDASFAKLCDSGMVADSGFIMDVMVEECADGVFRGISSLVDVAGGLGGAAQAIAKAFPHIDCSVLDLPNVVAAAPTSTDVKYIAGDMFQSIPAADVVFLKILQNCKKAIPSEGGKVIIMDIVVGAGSSDRKHVETQVLFDLFIMAINGAERDEEEWKKIIFEAGFSSYNIIPVLGVRSIIEVYP
uniref:O-methyltransferase ZRP4 n=1 Tax=Zea mays TaxID=4577 RepID=A0A804Q141_MAIZE